MRLLKRISRFIQSRKALIAIFLSYIIAGNVMLSVLSGYLYNQFAKSTLQDINNATVAMLEYSAFQFNQQIEHMLTQYYQLFISDPDILTGLYGNDLTDQQTQQIVQKLQANRTLFPWVYTVTLVNTKQDYIISTKYSKRSLSEYNQFDRTLFSDVATYSFGERIAPFSRKVIYTPYEHASEEMPVISFVLTSDKTLSSFLIIDLNQQALHSMIRPLSGDENYKLLLLGENGQLLSTDDSTQVGSMVSDQGYFQSIRETSLPYGSFLEDENERQLNYSFYRNGTWPIIFVNQVEQNYLLRNMVALQKKVWVCLSIFLICSSALAILFTFYTYHPINRMLKIAERDPQTAALKKSSEFCIITDYLENAEKNNFKLSVASEAKRRDLLQQLYKGEYVSDWKSQAEQYGLVLDLPMYLVCLLQIHPETQEFPENERNLYRFRICSIAEKLFDSPQNCIVSEYSANTICIIFNSSQETDVSARFQTLQRFVYEQFSILLTVAVGEWCEDLADVSYSFQAACANLKYQLFYGRMSIITGADVAKRMNQPYLFPQREFDQLVKSIREANEENLLEACGKFFTRIENYDYNLAILSLTQMLVLADQTIENELHLKNEGLTECIKKLNQYVEKSTLQELQEWIGSEFIKTLSAIKSQQTDRKSDYVNAISSYVQEHFQSSSLSVDEIAAAVRLSPNYARKIFRDATGQTLSDYISDVRFRQACQLLASTNYPAKVISEMVGQANCNYFYTAFKKKMGKTPDQYRHEMEKRNPTL